MSPWPHQCNGCGVGGLFHSLAFPTRIIMALGVDPNFPSSVPTLPPLSQFLIWVQWSLAVHCPVPLKHVIKSSWTGSVNSRGEGGWLCRSTVKSPSRVIHYSRFMCISASGLTCERVIALRGAPLWTLLSGSGGKCLFNGQTGQVEKTPSPHQQHHQMYALDLDGLLIEARWPD